MAFSETKLVQMTQKFTQKLLIEMQWKAKIEMKGSNESLKSPDRPFSSKSDDHSICMGIKVLTIRGVLSPQW